MSLRITELPVTEPAEPSETGLGALHTSQGNLPLRGLDIDTAILGLSARTVVTQRFHNPHPDPIEAVYIFPLPERAAVTDMSMVVADRTVTADLQERGEARRNYAAAIAEGKRAALAEAERADVFTMTVGNILPGEEATVTITLVGPLAYEDDEATYRMPLVVAPRYIPGTPTGEAPVGDGYAQDTDAVGDASRITPPVLLPGFPNPVELSITVDIDPGGLCLPQVSSSLHAVVTEEDPQGRVRVRIEPGERVNRDFILRLDYGSAAQISHTVSTAADTEDPDSGTFQLTVLPPRQESGLGHRDVVVLLDRSGSMGGWKMVAARRAASRIVDTLSTSDRFAVRCFDTEMTSPAGLESGLVPGTDRNRYRAVEHLAGTQSRGGTQMLAPLVGAAELLRADDTDSDRDRVIVLVTDGQVGNEDQILAELSTRLDGIRVHVVGIDRAVNAGFLHRLALAGRGRCELVESEDRLDAATAHIHRRIVAPVVTDVTITARGAEIVPDTVAPARIGDLFTGAPMVVAGRYRRREPDPEFTVEGTDADGKPWRASVPVVPATDSAPSAMSICASWARAHLRDLEDRYVSAPRATDLDALEKTIVDTSLRYRVLSRFTAFVAIDSHVVTEGGTPRTVVQPVELPEGWAVPPPALGIAPPAPPMNLMAAPASIQGGPSAGYGAAPPAPSAPGAPGAAGSPTLRRFAPRGRPAVVRPTKPAVGGRGRRGMDMEQIREVLAAELGLLTGAADSEPSSPSAGRERRMLLSDLATRLEVLVDPLSEVDSDAAQRLRALASQLADCESATPPTGADLETLWQRTIRLLTELSGTTAVTDSGEAEAASKSSRGGGAFWKRRP